MSLTSDIREYGLSLGYDSIAVTNAESFPIYQRELTERREMYSWSAGQPEQWISTADPATAFPEGRFMLSALPLKYQTDGGPAPLSSVKSAMYTFSPLNGACRIFCNSFIFD